MHGRRWPASQPRRHATIWRLSAPLFLMCGLLALALAPAPARAAGPLYFAQTGHNVPDIFANYWSAHGGLDRFGLPLTEPYKQDGLTVQYFERARFERHSEYQDTPYEVLLGQLGRELHPLDPPVQPLGDAGARYFPQTGHNVTLFRAYWESHNGLADLGLPLSEEVTEVNAANGQSDRVQYFERARLEYHPECQGQPCEVQLGQLGAERYQQVRANDQTASVAGAAVPPPVTADAHTTGSSIEMLMWHTVNNDRAQAGAAPLAFDPLVAKAAQAHVADMIANNFIEHSGSDGSTPRDRMTQQGVQGQWFSENIAMECSKDSATAVANIEGWMMGEPYASDLYNHHWNLIYTGYTRIGIAFGVAPNGCWVMAEDFTDGAPAPGSQT